MTDKRQEFFNDIRKKIQNFQLGKTPGEISKTHEKKEFMIRPKTNDRNSIDKESSIHIKENIGHCHAKISSLMGDKNFNTISTLEGAAKNPNLENGNEKEKKDFKDLLDLHNFPYDKLEIKSKFEYEKFMNSPPGKEIKTDTLKRFLNLKTEDCFNQLSEQNINSNKKNFAFKIIQDSKYISDKKFTEDNLGTNEKVQKLKKEFISFLDYSSDTNKKEKNNSIKKPYAGNLNAKLNLSELESKITKPAKFINHVSIQNSNRANSNNPTKVDRTYVHIENSNTNFKDQLRTFKHLINKDDFSYNSNFDKYSNDAKSTKNSNLKKGDKINFSDFSNFSSIIQYNCNNEATSSRNILSAQDETSYRNINSKYKVEEITSLLTKIRNLNDKDITKLNAR
jgi:hypothetical protein